MRSEGLSWEYYIILHEVVGLVEAGFGFSALFSLIFSPSLFSEVIIKGAKKTLLLETLASRDTRRSYASDARFVCSRSIP